MADRVAGYRGSLLSMPDNAGKENPFYLQNKCWRFRDIEWEIQVDFNWQLVG